MKRYRLFFIILSVVLVLSTTTPIAVAMNSSKKIDMDLYMKYINEVLPGYLAQDIQGELDNVQISQGFEINGNPDENSLTFFITNDCKYIGMLIVSNVNGAFHSSFGYDCNDFITNLITSKEPIALLVVDNGMLFIKASSFIYSLSQTKELSDLHYYRLLIDDSSYVMSEIMLNDVAFTSDDIITYVELMQSRNPVSIERPVPFVSNDTTPNGNELCWAAAVTSVGRYRNPLSGQPTTAMGLYNRLDNDYSGTPAGTNTWYTRGYSVFGLTATNTSSGLSYNSVLSNLQAYNPFIVRMSRSGSNEGHAIVCKGLRSSSSIGTYYTFMDPNFTSNRTIHCQYEQQSINNNSFVYVGTFTYTSWYATVY